MLRFFIGIILVQLVTIALFFSAGSAGLDNTQLMLTIGLLEILFSVLAAFWFSSIARHRHMDELEIINEAHAQEREKIRVNAERQKSRIVSKSQQQILKETRRAHAGANFKVVAAFAGALALGTVMLYSQFVTFGLLILTTAGGGLAGYLAKGRQVFLARRKESATQQQAMLPQGKPVKKIK